METSTPRSHIIIRNTLWNFLSQGWFLLLAFVTTPYIVRKLGTDAYGILSIVNTIIGYFGFLHLGLGKAVVKYISEYYAKREFDTIRKIIGTALIVYSLIGFIGAIIVAFLTSILVTKVLKIPSNLINVSSFVFYISALGFLINMPHNVLGTIPRALQRFDITSKISICIGTLQILSTIFLLYLGYFLKQIVIMNILLNLLSLSIYFMISKLLLPQLQVPTFSKNMLCKLFKFGKFIAVTRVSIFSGTQLGKFLIGVFHPISFITYYTIPYALSSKLLLISKNIVSATFPATSELFILNQKKELQELHLRSTKYIMIILVPITLFLIMFSKEILTLWISPDFAVQGSFSLKVLALAGLITCLTLTCTNVAQAAGRPDIPAKVHILQAIFSILLCFLLIPLWRVNGAAIAWLMQAGLSLIILYRVNQEVIKILNWQFVKIGLGIPLIIGVTVYYSFIPFRYFITNLTILLALFIFLGVIYGIITYFFGFDDKDRKLISYYLCYSRPQYS